MPRFKQVLGYVLVGTLLTTVARYWAWQPVTIVCAAMNLGYLFGERRWLG